METIRKIRSRRSSLGNFLFGSSEREEQQLELLRNRHILNDRRFSVNPAVSSPDNQLLSRNAARRFSRKEIPSDSRATHDFESASDSETDETKNKDFLEDPPTNLRRNRILSQQNNANPFLHPPQNQIGAHTFRRVSTNPSMRKVMRCVVLGAHRSGKSTILQQLACVDDPLQRPYIPTIEDTYQIQTGIDSTDRPREIVIFHDTAGVTRGPIELKRPYLCVADAFVLVYSVLNIDSFERVDAIKKYIDKNAPKDKREIPIVLIGTMIDLPGRQVDTEMAATWASKERVKFFEVTAQDRGSLVDVVHYLVGRHFHPIKESKFSLSKKLKPERSAQILMDL